MYKLKKEKLVIQTLETHWFTTSKKHSHYTLQNQNFKFQNLKSKISKSKIQNFKIQKI
jgi:subtilase family serine protease